MPTIKFEIETCAECPVVSTTGYHELRFTCSAFEWSGRNPRILKRGAGRLIASGIESASQMPPVPEWCPHLADAPRKNEEGGKRLDETS